MSVSRKIVSVFLALTLAAGLSGLVGCQQSGFTGNGPLHLVTANTLTIGSDCDYPPFISMDGAQPQGFEYELMTAIAADMGLTLVYLPPQNFDTLVASVQGQGKMDLAVSSMTINPERQQSVNFCTPYFDSNQAVVTLKTSTYTSVNDLAGKVVGAQSGTTGMDWAKENIPGATVKGYNQTSEGLAALRAGEIQALIFDEPVASAQVAGSYNDCQVMQVIATGEQYGFAVSKDNPALEAAVNTSLQHMFDNGTYDRLFKKYFPHMTPTVH
ncbi:MAG: ABC transporter substrate-binding protein [Actinomycetia bacterium]|nr:ABC transporter substrate-binding protein [Actinomycetes bacterium]